MKDSRIALDFDTVRYRTLIPAFRHDGREPRERWQQRAYDRLFTLLGLDRFEKPLEDRFAVEPSFVVGALRITPFSFQSEEGYTVPAYLAMPKEQGEEQRPLCICLQGHSTGMHNSLHLRPDRTPMSEEERARVDSGDRGFCTRAVQEGYAAVCIEQRYMGVTGTRNEKPGCSSLQSMAALMMGRTAIGCRVWDVMRLLDTVERYFPFIDTANTVCLGNSGGGTTTFYAACMERRIRYAVSSCAFCTYRDSIVDLRHCCCNYIPRIAFDFDMGDLAGLIAPRNLLVVNGSEDDIFPAFGVQEAFRTAGSAFECFGGRIALVTGEGGHRFYADPAYKVLHQWEKEDGAR